MPLRRMMLYVYCRYCLLIIASFDLAGRWASSLQSIHKTIPAVCDFPFFRQMVDRLIDFEHYAPIMCLLIFLHNYITIFDGVMFYYLVYEILLGKYYKFAYHWCSEVRHIYARFLVYRVCDVFNIYVRFLMLQSIWNNQTYIPPQR